MNILVINWQDRLNPFSGGAEIHLHEVFKRIVTYGHRVILLASGFPKADSTENVDGIYVIRKGNRATFNFYVPFAIKKIMRKESIDILIEDLNKIPFFTPLFINIPIFAILHHRFGKSIFRETVFPLASYVYLAESLIPVVYKNIPFDVVSESTRDDLVRSGIPEENIYIHYNGIDHKKYRANLESKEPFLITFLGRIKRYKSIEHLLFSLYKLKDEFPHLHCIIVGDGDALTDLKRLAYSLGLSNRVIFKGFVPENEKIDILQRSEIVVNTSSKEGWGLTVVESNACGTPVVAANSPGLRDSVKDGYNGLLYQYGNIDALTNAIRRLLSNKQLRLEMQKKAIEWAERFDWDKTAIGITRLLKKRINGEI
ncbi:MAG: hypothetical protein B5M53_02135 [Candidatus Cloacimonas sp. 4484_209]|nr:MAG: hypothetical protein B5M53_02135 [Candidatus Cloacimonas sp. 4484_209]